MNASKTLTALAAAAALVGTIGYASAQQGTTGSDTMAPNAGSPADTAQPGVTPSAPADMSGTSGTTSTLPSDAAATMDSERAPQADRN